MNLAKITAVFTLLCAIFAGGANTGAMAAAKPSTAATVSAPGFADLVERVRPAVVNISVSGRAPARPGFSAPPNSPQERFFRRFFGEQFPGSRAPQKTRAAGSGFIISADGFVVTNHHVIARADNITVILDDGARLEATVRGVDRHTDLALLHVESGRPLPFVRFGDSDAARVGDWVLAIGNPFGLGGTTTGGIISARGRELSAGPYDDFIQVDAPINRGNSGGPLFNTAGEVIGVNTAIISPNGGSVGIGFAVPASTAAGVVDDLMKTGAVARGWLGVRIQELSAELAEGLGMAGGDGVLVAGVVPGSPAERAGLSAGDVIIRYDGAAIRRLRDLPRRVAATDRGTEVTVNVWRDGAARDITVTIAGRDNDVVAATDDLGMTLRDTGGDGVTVAEVAADSISARHGIRAGDVIIRAGAKPARRASDVRAAITDARKQKRKSVVLLIARGGDDGGRFVALPVS